MTFLYGWFGCNAGPILIVIGLFMLIIAGVGIVWLRKERKKDREVKKGDYA
jgi:uncharacterized membrane protein YdjX (TVP38/TMEM64 family)